MIFYIKKAEVTLSNMYVPFLTYFERITDTLNNWSNETSVTNKGFLPCVIFGMNIKMICLRKSFAIQSTCVRSRLRCLLRLPEGYNDLSYKEQLQGLSSVWNLKFVLRAPDCENDLTHKVQV